MPLFAAHVGRRTEPVRHTADTRWLLAFSACVQASAPELLDTRLPEGVLGHPLFPVCAEWPLVLASQRLLGTDLTRTEAGRGVHATHDLTVHRLVRPGDILSTTAEIALVERHRSGAFQELLFETTDLAGAPVATTRMGLIFRGVETDAPEGTGDEDVASGGSGRNERPLDAASVSERPLHVGPELAHTYTECSRIWNPIHTDLAIAEAAGLPATILHGTCTLALAVSGVLGGGAGAGRVRRVEARFSGMVSMPSVLTLRWCDQGERINFAVVGPAGEPILRDGSLELGDPLLSSDGPSAG